MSHYYVLAAIWLGAAAWFWRQIYKELFVDPVLAGLPLILMTLFALCATVAGVASIGVATTI